MNLPIPQHYNGPNINQNPLLFFTWLSQKSSLCAVLFSAEWPKVYNNSEQYEKKFEKVETLYLYVASQTWDYAKKGG